MPYAPLLSEEAITAGLVELPDWERDGASIRRELRFATFPDAIAFVDRVAELAEAADHHPDIDIRWRSVVLVLTTKASHGLTERDMGLAKQIDALAVEMAAQTAPRSATQPAVGG
jgi:4a-hydroxytetrahydrobiopterin dehydratase